MAHHVSRVCKTVELYKLEVIRVPTTSKIELPAMLRTSGQVAEAFMAFAEQADREHLIVVPLDTKLRPHGYQIIATGTLNAVGTTMREVFKVAVVSNAHSIILLHNHVAGNPNPSADDVSMTIQAKESGDLLGIKLLDHCIVTGKNYYSFLEKRPQIFEK